MECIYVVVYLFEIAVHSLSHVKLKEMIVTLPGDVFLDLAVGIKEILNTLQRGTSVHTKVIIRSLLGCFRVRRGTGEITRPLLKELCVIHVSSPLL